MTVKDTNDPTCSTSMNITIPNCNQGGGTNDACPSSANQSNVTYSQNTTIVASNDINATNCTINNGVTVTFDAGGIIILNSGMTINQNSNFIMKLEGCDL